MKKDLSTFLAFFLIVSFALSACCSQPVATQAPAPEIPDKVRTANPETYIRPGLPLFFIQHGTHDDVVPHQQSLNFAAKLAAIAPQTVSHELLPNARHADPAFETS